MEKVLVFGDECEEEKMRTLEQTLQGCREQGCNRVNTPGLHISFENENPKFSFFFLFSYLGNIAKLGILSATHSN